ncbi:MAG: OmpA family protein [Bacteroidales bacterium]|nr:OmpA family protein [Bacteroidales bacterium]
MSGVFGAEVASAQDTKEMVKTAEAAFVNSDWKQAKSQYEALTKAEASNPMYHAQLGKCLLNLGKKEEAIAELQKAQSLYTDKQKAKEVAQKNALVLAHAQKEVNKVDDAIKTLEDLQPNVKNKAIKALVENELEACKVAKDLRSNPKDEMVLNLGAFVNDKEGKADHSAVLSNDKKQMYFTSRRKADGHSVVSEDQVDENLYVSNLDATTKTYAKAEIYNGDINTNAHDAVIAISPDGTELYIYREDDNGSILVSKKSGSSWSTPEMLGGDINTPYEEKGAALSPDGQKLYFASDRPGTLGGLDIWVAQRQGDSWGNVKNLGKAINTSESEEGPFVSKDGSTLYFASRGHKSLGGYDLFKAAINGDSFGDAENLGCPINTGDDEMYPFVDGQKVYFSSNRPNGMGDADQNNLDIWVAGPTSVMQTAQTDLNGKVRVCHDAQIVSRVEVRDNSNASIQKLSPSADGAFTIKTYRGHNYTITVYADEKPVFTEDFDVAVDAAASQEYKTIQLDPGYDCDKYDQELAARAAEEERNKKNCEDGVCYDFFVEIEDITFAFGKADPFGENASLNVLADYLKEYPKAKVEVNGYADAQGSSSLNYTLARKRALTAQSYLLKKGVKSSQIKVASMGEENPVSLNFVNGEINEDSKKFNRRLEFNMLEQGEKTMLIRAIRNIPSQYKNADYKRKYTKKPGMPETTL